MIGAAGILSALFVNDVVYLVLAPLILSMTRELALPPVPYLVALATAANVGSVATLTGNPQNMLVGSFSNLSYRDFFYGKVRSPSSASCTSLPSCGSYTGESSPPPSRRSR